MPAVTAARPRGMRRCAGGSRWCAVIAAPPDGDAVRELYGELVDRYRDQPARLARIRAIGDEIRRLEAEGTLASSLVARSDRRPHRP